MFTIDEMNWFTANDIDEDRAEVLIGSIDVSPITVNFRWGGASNHLLTVLGPLAKNLLCDSPIILFSQSHMGIIEEH